MRKYWINFFIKKNKIYKIPSGDYINYLLKKFLFIKKNINLNFINLLDIFILNKYYKFKNTPTNILIFNNIFLYKNFSDFYLCNIMIESESLILNKNLFYFYIYIILHGLLHSQKFLHKKYFYKKNIFNYLEFKFLNKIGFKNSYKYVNISKYNKYFN